MSCTHLKLDASYKAIKKLFMSAQAGGQQLFKCIIMALNNWGQVRTQVVTSSDSHEQIQSALVAMKNSMDQLGLDPVRLVSTDKPRQDEAFMHSTFPALKEFQEYLDKGANLYESKLEVATTMSKAAEATTDPYQVTTGVTEETPLADTPNSLHLIRDSEGEWIIMAVCGNAQINAKLIALEELLDQAGVEHPVFSLDAEWDMAPFSKAKTGKV